jgi:lysine/ornithine N-monooxygenase
MSNPLHRRAPLEYHRRNAFSKNSDADETVELSLIEDIYQDQIGIDKPGCSSAMNRCKILSLHKLASSTQDPEGRVLLTFINPRDETTYPLADPFDVVIAATGYERREWKRLLGLLRDLVLDAENIQIERDYKVAFRKRALSDGVGIWVMGSFEAGSDVSAPSPQLSIEPSLRFFCRLWE